MRFYSLMLLLLIGNPAWAGFGTNNEDGINSFGLGLDGTGILIGQVERNRSAKQDYDGNGFAAANTKPTGVYYGAYNGSNMGMDDRNGLGLSDPDAFPHATNVAQVMIGKLTPEGAGAAWEGVAPNSQLHSIAIGNDPYYPIEQALNRAATLGSGAVRATNMSFGTALDTTFECSFVGCEDGNSHLTQFIDWSASFHDVLYVAAWGNASSDQFRKPGDNFNGMTIAASEPCSDPQNTACAADMHSYRRYSPEINATDGDAYGDRTSIDLIAPGRQVRTLDAQEQDSAHDGTSFATPHVTGAVALLQQYTKKQMDPPISNSRFTTNSQRHEVMKAVLLNSADKLKNIHGSKRTVLDGNNLDWTQSEAFNSQFVSLDDQMGAGHLNVGSALQQFTPGEYNPGTVPLIGWDYGTIGSPGARQEYYFDQNLGADK